MHRPANTAQRPGAREHSIGARGKGTQYRDQGPGCQEGRRECTVSDTNIHHVAKRHVIGLARSALEYLNSATQSVHGLSYSVDLTGST